MNYLKFTQYAYLIAAVLFAIDAFQKYQEGETNNTIISGIFAAVCIFMFFFRGKYAKKFEERNKKP
ncbi:MAG: hypothetical protein IM568_05170 [Flavobacterium sp.]|nr:hypothetical protein [Flavobacterium sp.]